MVLLAAGAAFDRPKPNAWVKPRRTAVTMRANDPPMVEITSAPVAREAIVSPIALVAAVDVETAMETTTWNAAVAASARTWDADVATAKSRMPTDFADEATDATEVATVVAAAFAADTEPVAAIATAKTMDRAADTADVAATEVALLVARTSPTAVPDAMATVSKKTRIAEAETPAATSIDAA